MKDSIFCIRMYRVFARRVYKLLNKFDRPIVKLQECVIRQKNGNFVGFQNMCSFKMSDHQ